MLRDLKAIERREHPIAENVLAHLTRVKLDLCGRLTRLRSNLNNASGITLRATPGHVHEESSTS